MKRYKKRKLHYITVNLPLYDSGIWEDEILKCICKAVRNRAMYERDCIINDYNHSFRGKIHPIKYIYTLCDVFMDYTSLRGTDFRYSIHVEDTKGRDFYL